MPFERDGDRHRVPPARCRLKLPLREGLACCSIKARLERLHNAYITDRPIPVYDAQENNTPADPRAHGIGRVLWLDISGEYRQAHGWGTPSGDIVPERNRRPP